MLPFWQDESVTFVVGASLVKVPELGVAHLLGACDNPQEQGITVAPLNVEIRYRSAGARRKSYLFPTTKVSQVLVDYALNKLREQDGWFDGCKSVPILFFARGQDKDSNK